MKITIAVAVAVLGFVAASIWIAATVREEPVVENPYQEGLKLGRREGAAPAPAPAAAGAGDACDLGTSPCARALPALGALRLELGPRPLHTMQDLTVRVDLGAPAAEGTLVSVSFSMRGMSMGENRARLVRSGPGRFEGKAVLVRCSSGRREWLADVEVASPGAPARSARFALTVAE